MGFVMDTHKFYEFWKGMFFFVSTFFWSIFPYRRLVMWIDGSCGVFSMDRQQAMGYVFICGPEPLMDAMEIAIPELGVPVENVLTERFDMI